MELKEYLAILKVNSKVFGGVIAIVILASFSYFYLKPLSYEASLVLNITRSGAQKSEQYKFDDFYAFPIDLMRESACLHSRQRAITFDIVRSNPKFNGADRLERR